MSLTGLVKVVSMIWVFTWNHLKHYDNFVLRILDSCGCKLHKSPCVYYRKTSYISRTLVIYKIVDNSDVVGASPVGAAPTTSSFST